MVEIECASRHGLHLVHICKLSPRRATEICLVFLISDKNFVVLGGHCQLDQFDLKCPMVINGNVGMTSSRCKTLDLPF